MALTITREFNFCAGHRLKDHEGGCRFLHGHNYRAEIEVEGVGLNALNMIVDFSHVKKLVGGWIDQYWDHNFLLNTNDPYRPAVEEIHAEQGKVPYLFAGNPTAEAMACVLHKEANRLLSPLSLSVISTTIWETEKCRATVGP